MSAAVNAFVEIVTAALLHPRKDEDALAKIENELARLKAVQAMHISEADFVAAGDAYAVRRRTDVDAARAALAAKFKKP